MNNITTQNNTAANPAKKQWQKPDFYLIDSNEDVNAKNVVADLEAAPPGAGPGNASTYQS